MQHMEGARYLHRDLKQYYPQLQKKNLQSDEFILSCDCAASGKSCIWQECTTDAFDRFWKTVAG